MKQLVMKMLPTRWNKLRYHPVQHALWKCDKRFIVVPAGRRSGKTELAKRKLIKTALKHNSSNNGKYVFAAPTHTQAREIYWADTKAFVPTDALLTPEKPWKSISESSSSIFLWNGAKIQIAGMDRPERAEGTPIDGIVLDEYGNMKKETWTEHIRPALSTPDRLGWAWLIGVPEGRNHYYERAKEAMALHDRETSWEDSWAYFHWFSSDILSPYEISAAMRDLDELTYRQEYEGSFINFTGRAYYNFTREANANRRVEYDPELDLVFCFDFNVSPGTATAIQEHSIGTCVVGEVYIPRNSNTLRVCDKLISMYGNHKQKVWVCGDATGGARGSAKVMGSDWDLVQSRLKPVFGDKLIFRVAKSNPKERSRVNAVNSRCKSMDGDIRLFVDPMNCPKTVDDFENVVVVEGGSGEIDKSADPTKTHLTDGIGYYIVFRWPTKTTGIDPTNQVIAMR